MVAGRQRRELCEEEDDGEVGSPDREEVVGVAHVQDVLGREAVRALLAMPGSTVYVTERTFDRKSSSGVGAEGV